MERDEVIRIIEGLVNTASRGHGFEHQGPPPDQASLSALQALRDALKGDGDTKAILNAHKESLEQAYANVEEGAFVVSEEFGTIHKSDLRDLNNSFALRLTLGAHTQSVSEKGGGDKGINI